MYNIIIYMYGEYHGKFCSNVHCFTCKGKLPKVMYSIIYFIIKHAFLYGYDN